MRGLLILFVAALVGCDHATKVVAKITLEGGAPRSVIPGVMDLVYTENRNVAFSVFHGFTSPIKGPLILLMACLASVAIAVAWWKRWRAASLLEHTAFALVIGGALGNVLDRWQRGYVVDFIHIQLWPVFNVADVAVCVGGALVGLVMTFKKVKAATKPPKVSKSGVRALRSRTRDLDVPAGAGAPPQKKAYGFRASPGVPSASRASHDGACGWVLERDAAQKERAPGLTKGTALSSRSPSPRCGSALPPSRDHVSGSFSSSRERSSVGRLTSTPSSCRS